MKGERHGTGDQLRAVFERLDRSFRDGAALHILMKDIDPAIDQGEEFGLPLWVCQASRLVYKHAMFAGAADDDISTLVRHVERGAGRDTNSASKESA